MNQEPPTSIVIYSRRTPSPDHTAVNAPGAAPIYIRAAVVAGDVVEALDAANPGRDETTLNTIPLT